ncbi:MAG: hypothetical protein ACOVQB_08835 [Polynucleobacter sp.]
MTIKSKIILVGNKKSLLFCQRSDTLKDVSSPERNTILDTGDRTLIGLIKFAGIFIFILFRLMFNTNTMHIILHGAYSPVLWPLLFLRRVRAVSIVQGSELTVDFVGVRAHIVTMILRHSVIIACRNEIQIDDVIRLCGVKREVCVVVNWGLKKELFELPFPHKYEVPVLISPRATQREYNIPVIFTAVAKLKKDGFRFRFIYVRFNPSFEIEDTSPADEILEAPAQDELWLKISQADICISVPDYDGLSNTILETLALGSTPLYSDLKPYAFLKEDARLGIALPLGDSFEKNVLLLNASLQCALLRIEELRSSMKFRRDFAEKFFRAGSGVDRILSELSND